MIIKSPSILDNILSENDFRLLKNHAIQLSETSGADDIGFGRKTYGGTEILKYIHRILMPKAREFFESDSLQPSFSMIAVYQGDQASLFRHKDDNACTYHFDISIFQDEPWDIWVEHEGESKAYTLHPNQALAMYGEDQEHWREDFPSDPNSLLCNAFFFFCEPDHWYFTKGPDYLHVIRQKYAKQ